LPAQLQLDIETQIKKEEMSKLYIVFPEDIVTV